MPFGILSGLLETGMDYGLSQLARQDNYGYWKKMNDRMFAQQQRAELLSPRNRAEGLKMAGLNPSLAAHSSPMAIGAAPMPSTQSHASVKMDSKLPELALLQAQKENVEEETRRVRIDNDNKEHENSGAGEALKSYAGYVLENSNLNPEQKAYWELILDKPNSAFNVGDINAEMRFKDLVNKHVDTTANAYAKSYSNYMYTAYTNGKMADLDLKLKANQAEELFSKIGEIQANTALLEAKTDLTEKEKEEITARTNKAILEAQKIYHDDLVALFRDEQWQALGVKAAEKAIDDLPGIIEMFQRSKKRSKKSDKFPESD